VMVCFWWQSGRRGGQFSTAAFGPIGEVGTLVYDDAKCHLAEL